MFSLWRSVLAAVFSVTTAVSAVSAAEQVLPQGYDELTRTGEVAFSKNNYGLSEKCFLAALKEAERFGPTDLRVAHSCKNLASFYEVRSNPAKMEMYLERELRVREKALGGEHLQVIQCVGKVTRFHLSRENKQKSERLTGLLSAYADKVIKEQHSVDNHFSDINKYYTRHSEYQEVQKQLNKLQELSHKIRSDDYLELAAMLDGIGVIYQEKNRLGLAEQMFKKSLALREKALSPDHQALAMSYEHLGSLYQSQGKTELAQPLLHRAMEVASKSGRPAAGYAVVSSSPAPPPPPPPSSSSSSPSPSPSPSSSSLLRGVSTTKRVAENQLAQGRGLSKAEAAIPLVPTGANLVGGNSFVSTSAAGSSLQSAKLNQLTAKDSGLPPATGSQSALLPLPKITVDGFARVDALARSYADLGKADQAEALYAQALVALRASNPPRNKDIASASMALGTLYAKRGKYSQASGLFKTALNLLEGMSGPQSSSLIPILDSYADSLEKCNNLAEAAKIRSRANLIKGAATACKPSDPAKDF